MSQGSGKQGRAWWLECLCPLAWLASTAVHSSAAVHTRAQKSTPEQHSQQSLTWAIWGEVCGERTPWGNLRLSWKAWVKRREAAQVAPCSRPSMTAITVPVRPCPPQLQAEEAGQRGEGGCGD